MSLNEDTIAGNRRRPIPFPLWSVIAIVSVVLMAVIP